MKLISRLNTATVPSADSVAGGFPLDRIVKELSRGEADR